MTSTLSANLREPLSCSTFTAIRRVPAFALPGAVYSADANGFDDTAATRLLSAEAPDEAALGSCDPEVRSQIDEALARFPAVGQTFLGFRLIHELGRGGFGRVFLAQQIELANRPVALKVSVDLRGESQRLAQLQHTNIMPLYSEHVTDKLHAVCMPFLGCTTLADICKTLRGNRGLPTSGQHFVGTLHNRQSTVQSGLQSAVSEFSLEEPASAVEEETLGKLPRLAKSNTVLAHIENLSYEDAVLWIGARLASGLAHAHERGILHRDLKPANILLTDDGEPMLLDFNLAEDMKLRSSITAKIGGTLPYMSPEQLAGYTHPAVALDGRSDVYSLGLILFQLLTGKFPFPMHHGRTRDLLPRMIKDRRELPELRSHNPAVTPAVEAIVRRCLQPDPDLRYSCAESLLEDVERHQKHLPLRHTPEPSFAERMRKWARRNPRLVSLPVLAAGTMAILLGVAGVLLSLSYRAKERELDRRRETAVEKYHDFQQRFQRAECLLSVEDPEQLQEGIRDAEAALAAYGVLEEAKWAEKPEVEHLPPEDRARLRQDVGELGLLLSRSAASQPARPSSDESVRYYRELATTHLGEKEQLVLAAHRSEWEGRADREDYQKLRLKLEASEQFSGRSPLLLASDCMAHGQYQEALKLLKPALERDNTDFGCWYLRAHCHLALKEEVDALYSLGVCIALRPKFARSYHTRACVLYSQRKNLEQAKADLDHALRLQPSLLSAYIDRGLVLFALGKHKESLVDIDWALSCPEVPKRVYFIRAMLRDALRDKKGAEQDRAEGLKQTPADAVSWVTRGVARIAVDPKAALEDFMQAEKINARYFPAVMNQSYVLGECLKKPTEAIRVLDRLIELFPDSADARTAKAIYLARLGKADEAVREAKEALAIGSQPDLKYRIACVYALVSEKHPKYRKQSLQLLAEALKTGHGYDRIDRDDDLNLLRKQPEFAKFLDLVKTLQQWGFTSEGTK